MKIHIANCIKKQKNHYINLIANAFRTLGHEVFEFDNEDYPSHHLAIDRIIRRSPLFLVAKKRPEDFDFKQKYKDFVGKQWLKTLKQFNPDLVLIINSGWLSRDSFRVAKENLRLQNIVCWIVDDPSRSEAEDLVGCLPYCDNIFVVDKAWIPFISFFNKNISYLPLGTSDIGYRPLNQDRTLDLSFVGSFFRKDPGGFLRSFIISNLPPEYGVEIYGPGINYFKNIYPKLKNFKCYDKSISIEETNKLWNRSKLTATIYNPQVLTGTAPRVFDAALTKTCQIIQDTSSIHDLFSRIKLATFQSVPEFLTQVNYYLNHPKEREELAQEMFEAVKKKHLFVHRIKSIFELINLK